MMGKMKRIPRPFIKIKRLSRRKRNILLGREIKKYVQQKWEREKIHSILEAIATVNFKALKITGSSEIDHVKKISAISIYGHIYRNPVQENIFEDSIHVRPDVMRQLRNLDISDKNEENCNMNASHRDVVFDVSQKTFYLHINDSNEPDISDGIKNIVVWNTLMKEF